MDDRVAPSQKLTPALFRPVGPGGAQHLNGVFNRFHETDGVIAYGFENAAQLIVEKWAGGDTDDAYLMPLLLLYRHAIELNLKDAIRAVGEYVAEHGMVTNALSPQPLDKWIKDDARHNLGKLEGRLTEWLEAAGAQPLPDEVRETISELSELDPYGESFRYSTTWDRTAKAFVKTPKPAQELVDVPGLSAALAYACSTLSATHDWADNRNQFDRDIKSEFADG